MEKNNFEKYGFTGDFEGEILAEIGEYYIGYYLAPSPTPCRWTKKDGIEESLFDETLNLKPIKKEWNEIESNFPCIVIHLYSLRPHIVYGYNKEENTLKLANFSIPLYKCRPATKEETLALVLGE